jgi:endonuclease/exonuclease/phosphatase (EEP) superfamily protein YafD
MPAARKATLRAMRVALAGTVAATVAAALAPFGWPFELFAHFRWQLGAAALLLSLAALTLRRPGLAALAVATLALQWLPVAWRSSDSIAEPARGDCIGDDLRVVTANAWFENTQPAALLDWLARSDADVIVLQEVTPALAAALEPLARRYPYRKVLARDDPYGIALLSRWPAVAIEPIDFAADGLPSLVATLDVRDRTLQVVALHARWPILPELQAARDRALQRAARLVATRPDTTILLGDLNLTPYAPAFTRLLAASGLRDALAGEVWRPTWQAGFWPLALPIDHVLVPRSACVVSHETGPYVGSDHRPLRVTLRLR